MYEWRQMLDGKIPASSTAGATSRSGTTTSGRIGNRHAQRVFSGSCAGTPATSTTPKIACQTEA